MKMPPGIYYDGRYARWDSEEPAVGGLEVTQSVRTEASLGWDGLQLSLF
jgi:hypothetical protein